MSVSEIDDLICEYVRTAQEHAEGRFGGGDSQHGNIAADKNRELAKTILAKGRLGQHGLIDLLNSHDDSVRLTAAIHCLLFEEKKARKTLKRLSKGRGIVGLEAEMMLNEWDYGSLRSDLSADLEIEEGSD